MTNFGKRIRLLASNLGKEEQQIAKDLGLSKSQMSHYLNGNRKVPSELLQKIVDLYGINPSFLFYESAPLYKEEEKNEKEESGQYTYFPTAISAGLPLEVDGITESSKITASDELLGKWSNNKNIFFAHINGESMNRLMEDGSLIAIKPVSNTDELKNGDIVVYSVDGEYSVKHYYKYGDTLVFKPNSTIEHEEHTYNVNDNIIIHGVVVTYVINRD